MCRKFSKRVNFLALVFYLIGLCSCSHDAPDSIDEWLWDYASQHPLGFTINIRNLTVPQSGISVAYKETQNSFGRDGLKTAIVHAQGHDGYVGGWLNEDNADYYFDSVRIFPEDSLEQAIDFGIMNNQLAIYVISQDSTIYIADRHNNSFSNFNLPFLYNRWSHANFN